MVRPFLCLARWRKADMLNGLPRSHTQLLWRCRRAGVRNQVVWLPACFSHLGSLPWGGTPSLVPLESERDPWKWAAHPGCLTVLGRGCFPDPRPRAELGLPQGSNDDELEVHLLPRIHGGASESAGKQKLSSSWPEAPVAFVTGAGLSSPLPCADHYQELGWACSAKEADD